MRRRVCSAPRVTYYKPRGVPLNILSVEELSLEEWEALRLRYDEDLDQIASAERMHTSQSTLQRILSSAQRKVAYAVVKGKAIKIVRE